MTRHNLHTFHSVPHQQPHNYGETFARINCYIQTALLQLANENSTKWCESGVWLCSCHFRYEFQSTSNLNLNISSINYYITNYNHWEKHNSINIIFKQNKQTKKLYNSSAFLYTKIKKNNNNRNNTHFRCCLVCNLHDFKTHLTTTKIS